MNLSIQTEGLPSEHGSTGEARSRRLADLDQVYLMLCAEGLHQLDVHGLVAVGGEDAQVGLAPEFH